MTADANDPLLRVLQRLEQKAREASGHQGGGRQLREDWRPSGLLLALGELVDDEECLEERDAWPDFPARD